MNTHIDPVRFVDERIAVRKYRREGRIVVAVALIGLLIAVVRSWLAELVGSRLGWDVSPLFVLYLGIFLFVYGAFMVLVHQYRTTEDVVREMGGSTQDSLEDELPPELRDPADERWRYRM